MEQAGRTLRWRETQGSFWAIPGYFWAIPGCFWAFPFPHHDSSACEGAGRITVPCWHSAWSSWIGSSCWLPMECLSMQDPSPNTELLIPPEIRDCISLF